MRILRSRLLIALALLGVLAVGVDPSHASTIHLRYASADGSATNSGGSFDPNAGEPDVGQGATQTIRSSMTQVRREGVVAQPANVKWVREYALSVRWARVIWTARYLGLTR